MRCSRTILPALVLLVASVLHAGPREAGPIILCYHNVGEGEGIHSISREAFIQQMSYLKENGYNVISLSTLHELLTKGVKMPLNTVVVTVDDGWRSTMTQILPIMKRFNFPFTAFIYPRFVSGEGSSLSWDEIRKLAREGVDIQSHSYSHAFLTRGRQRSKSADAYSKWLWNELAGSRKEIEKQIGRPVRFLAYPYGDYDSRVAAAAEAAGYAAAVTCNHGPIVAGADAYRLRRYAIDRTTTLDQFRKYVRASGDPRPRKKAPETKLASLAPLKTPQKPAASTVKRVQLATTPTAFMNIHQASMASIPSSNRDQRPAASKLRENLAAILRNKRELKEADDANGES